MSYHSANGSHSTAAGSSYQADESDNRENSTASHDRGTRRFSRGFHSSRPGSTRKWSNASHQSMSSPLRKRSTDLFSDAMALAKRFSTRKRVVNDVDVTDSVEQYVQALSDGIHKRRDTRRDSLAWYILDPGAPMKVRWDCFIVVLVIYTVIWVPYRIAFVTGEESSVHATTDLVFDCMMLADVVMAFFTGYTDEHGQFISDLRLTSRKYFFSYFWPDLIASFPLDYVVGSGNLRISRVLRLLRLIKFFRMFRLVNLFSPGALRLFGLVFGLLYLFHVLGCVYYFISDSAGFGSNDWVLPEDTPANSDSLNYMLSYQWAISTTFSFTTLSSPGTMTQAVFTTFVILLGIIMNSIVIGSMGSALQSLDSERQHQQQYMDRVTQYLQRRHIPKRFQTALVEYFEQYHNKEVQENFLQDVPEEMRKRLRTLLNRHIVKDLPFLRTFPTHAVVRIMQSLESEMFWPGEFLFHVNDMADRLFFVRSGMLGVITADSTEHITTIEPGEIVGHIAVVENRPHQFSARVLERADVLKMSYEEFHDVAGAYPTFLDVVARSAVKQKTVIDRFNRQRRKEDRLQQTRLHQKQHLEKTRELRMERAKKMLKYASQRLSTTVFPDEVAHHPTGVAGQVLAGSPQPDSSPGHSPNPAQPGVGSVRSRLRDGVAASFRGVVEWGGGKGSGLDGKRSHRARYAMHVKRGSSDSGTGGLGSGSGSGSSSGSRRRAPGFRRRAPPRNQGDQAASGDPVLTSDESDTAIEDVARPGGASAAQTGLESVAESPLTGASGHSSDSAPDSGPNDSRLAMGGRDGGAAATTDGNIGHAGGRVPHIEMPRRAAKEHAEASQSTNFAAYDTETDPDDTDVDMLPRGPRPRLNHLQDPGQSGISRDQMDTAGSSASGHSSTASPPRTAPSSLPVGDRKALFAEAVQESLQVTSNDCEDAAEGVVGGDVADSVSGTAALPDTHGRQRSGSTPTVANSPPPVVQQRPAPGAEGEAKQPPAATGSSRGSDEHVVVAGVRLRRHVHPGRRHSHHGGQRVSSSADQRAGSGQRQMRHSMGTHNDSQSHRQSRQGPSLVVLHAEVLHRPMRRPTADAVTFVEADGIQVGQELEAVHPHAQANAAAPSVASTPATTPGTEPMRSRANSASDTPDSGIEQQVPDFGNSAVRRQPLTSTSSSSSIMSAGPELGVPMSTTILPTAAGAVAAAAATTTTTRKTPTTIAEVSDAAAAAAPTTPHDTTATHTFTTSTEETPASL